MVALLQPLSPGKQIPVDRAVVLVGRSPDCDFVLDVSTKISRLHCAIVQVDNTYFMRDLGSMNGVWVNGDRVDNERQIRNQDNVVIGDVQFQFIENGQLVKASTQAAKKAPTPTGRPNPKLIMEDDIRLKPETAVRDFVDDVDIIEVVDDVEILDDVEVIDDSEVLDVAEIIEDGVEIIDDVEILDDVEVVDDLDFLDSTSPPQRRRRR